MDIAVHAELAPSEPIFIALTPDTEISSVDSAVDFTLELADGDGYEDFSEIRFVIKEGTGTGTSDDAIVLWYSAYKPDRIYMWDHTENRWSWALMGTATF